MYTYFNISLRGICYIIQFNIKLIVHFDFVCFFEQAHELAVQTGCEVLVRFQDGRESPHCKYYVTDRMKHDYVNYGVRADPGDLPMSGESGLPKKYVHDFTCQVACEPTGPIPYAPEHTETHEAEIIRVQQHPNISVQGVHTSEEWQRLYRERLWTQQTSTSSTSKLEAAIHSEVQRRSPGANGPRPYVYPASSLIQSDASVPTATESHIVSHLDDNDAALRNLKQLHLKRLMRREIDQEAHTNEFPGQSKPANDHECFRVVTYLEDNAEQREEMVYVSQQENLPLAPQPPPPPPPPEPWPPQPQQELQTQDVRTNGLGFDPKTLPVGSTQQRYLCRICERTFCDIYNLVSHAKMFHSRLSELMFACNSCSSSFEDARSLHAHLQTHGNMGFFAGAACQLKSQSKDRQNVVQQRRFPCPDCGKIFSRFGFMQSHIERVHGGTRIAASMDTTALSKDTSLLSKDAMVFPKGHNEGNPVEDIIVVRNSSENMYRCMDCEESFDRAEILQQHIKESHLIPKTSSAPPSFTEDDEPPIQRMRSKSEDVTFVGKEIYTCQECGKQFPRGKLLQNHVNKYHISADPAAVASHREEQHEINRAAFVQPEQQYNNNVANSSVSVIKKEPNQEILDLSTGNSTRNSNLTLSDDSCDMPPDYPVSSPDTPGNEAKQMEDQEMADGNDQGFRRRRFACDVCGKTYKYGFHMKEHRLTHAAVCPFVCRICGMGFFRQRQLRDHELRHTGAYPCRCEICGKGFPRTSELKRHLAFRHNSHLDIFVRRKSTPSRNEEQT